jgi:hypothetical protein
MRFFADAQNDKKEGILHSAYAPFRMTKKDVQNDRIRGSEGMTE